MRCWHIVFLLLLTGCASVSPEQFVGPNGNTAYSMRCSGMGRTLDDCYKKAEKLCPDGYTVIDAASSIIAFPMDGGIMAVPQRSLSIECK